MQTTLPQSPLPNTRTIELTAECAPILQRFFEHNPAYFLATSGEPPGPNEALDEITSELPPGTPFNKKWVIGYLDGSGELVAMANVITDLIAISIFHIGTFIVATSRHGTGDAQLLNTSLEAWARANGAVWMRLGVVQGNERAERFWDRQGYIPVRERPGIQMGELTVTVRNMVKPLLGRPMAEYYALAPRDRPEGAA